MENLLKQMTKQQLMSEKNKQTMNTKINGDDRKKRINLIDVMIKKLGEE